MSSEYPSDNLKQVTLRSGFAKLFGQALNFVFRIAYMIILARLLDPKDFGLVAMVTAVTGVYQLFTTGGLSTATIQRAEITEQQVSNLFWLNILVGIKLSLLCVATAPMIARFYDEPRLFWITVAVSAGFLIGAAGVQHFALLQRQLRYISIAGIEAVTQLFSICIGIGMALAGFGYWALVAAAVVQPAVSTAGAWMLAGWIPSAPKRGAGVRSMVRLGATVTLNGVIVYIAYNLDKVLLGRFWGADTLGIYARAYYLIDIPTSNLNAAIGSVTFSALSRLQHDQSRLKSYFLKGYSVIVSMTLPTTVFCAVFADELIWVLLGPKWRETTIIFRLMAPTIFVFGMINPLYWLMLSLGLQRRSLNIALVIAPWVSAAYLVGLPYGAAGVALAFSAAMTLFLVPCLIWSVHGTVISARELLGTVSRPCLSAFAAGVVAYFFHASAANSLNAFSMLLLGGGIMLAVYLWVLLFVLNQRNFYFDLLGELIGSERIPFSPARRSSARTAGSQ
jgi:O-antigen/teichoic acid export membrane protein